MNKSWLPYMFLGYLWLLPGIQLMALTTETKLPCQDVSRTHGYLGGDTSIDGDYLVAGAVGEGSGAAYVYHWNGTSWLQEARLVAGDDTADLFGWAVAISGDTVIVGANGGTGSTYVFTRSGSTWTQQSKLTASDAEDGDSFGQSISISGNTVVIGAPDDDDLGESSGSAYIFTRSGTDWTQQAKLTASDGTVDNWFGASVTISLETVVIGAHQNYRTQYASRGSAYVFALDETGWSEQTKLTPSDVGIGDFFGRSVAISEDTIAVGAPGSENAYIFTLGETGWLESAKLTPGNDATPYGFGYSIAILGDTVAVSFLDNWESWSGGADVFVLSDDEWTPQARLTARDGAAGANFGVSVRISGDNIVVGASNDHDQGDNSGSVYVFNKGYGGTFTAWDAGSVDQVVKLGSQDFPFNLEDRNFGKTAAVDGNYAVVGAPGAFNDIGTRSGAVYVYHWNGWTWSQETKLTASDGVASGNFGSAVAISGDTMVISAYQEDYPEIGSGSVYVFSRFETRWIETAKLSSSDDAADDKFGCSAAISGNSIIVGASGGSEKPGSAYVFRNMALGWMELDKLTADDPQAGDRFGVSVAILGNTVVVGAEDENNECGSAYVFNLADGERTANEKLTAADGEDGDNFGNSVAISSNTIVVGASGDDDQGTFAGSAYVFTQSIDGWTEQTKLTASDGAAHYRFGGSVAISGDTILIGAAGGVERENFPGNAYVFELFDANWTESAKLVQSDGEGYDWFGHDVAISGDTALVGASGDDDQGTSAGSAYVFHLDQPPSVFRPIADITVFEDPEETVVNLRRTFIDHDDYGAAITKIVLDNDNPTLVATTIDMDTLTLDYQENQTGSATITIQATSNGKTVDETFVVTVLEVDDAPVVADEIIDVMVDEDAEDTIIDTTGTFADVDNDGPITKIILDNDNPTLVAATIDMDTLRLDYQENQYGRATIIIQATSDGRTVHETFTVTVSEVDDAPVVVDEIHDVMADEDAEDTIIDIAATFTDIDNDGPITKIILDDDNPTLVTATIDMGTLTLDYQENQTGSATITIQATSNGKTVNETFAVTVSEVDDAPIVANEIHDVIADEDAEDTIIDIAGTFTDVDNDGPITKIILDNDNQTLVAATIDMDTLTLDYQEDQTGSATITVQATSDGITVNDIFIVTVSEVDDAPVVANHIEEIMVDEDATSSRIDLINIFTDVDNDDSVITKIVLDNSNSALVTSRINDNVLSFEYFPDLYGSATITIQATSNGKTVEETFVVTVLEVDDAPVVAEEIDDIMADEDADDTIIDIAGTFTDIDNDGPIIIIILDNDNPTLVTATIDNNTLTLDYQENQTGSATITIQATSSDKTVDETFVVTVLEVDDAPVVAEEIDDIMADEDADDTIIDIAATFTDIDNDGPITKIILDNDNPTLVTATIDNNTLTLDYQEDQTGSATITIQATSNGKTVDNTFTVTVTEIDPVFSGANNSDDDGSCGCTMESGQNASVFYLTLATFMLVSVTARGSVLGKS